MIRQIATFFLGDTLLGVDILLVKEIFRQKAITRIPDAPDHLRGLMNLRGKIVTVIDLNVCLNRPVPSDMEKSRLLILKTRGEIGKCAVEADIADIDPGEDIVGFPIDRMDDVMAVDKTDILPTPANLKNVDNELITGVVKSGDRLVLLLDVGKVLGLVLDVAAAIE